MKDRIRGLALEAGAHFEIYYPASAFPDVNKDDIDHFSGYVMGYDQLIDFARRVAHMEQEECAKLCEGLRIGIDAFAGIEYHIKETIDACASSIRARQSI